MKPAQSKRKFVRDPRLLAITSATDGLPKYGKFCTAHDHADHPL